MCGVLQEKVYKTRVTNLDLMTTPLTVDRHNDVDVIQLGPLRSQLLFHFVEITDACFVHLLMQYIIHCYQQDSNLANLEAIVEVG